MSKFSNGGSVAEQAALNHLLRRLRQSEERPCSEPPCYSDLVDEGARMREETFGKARKYPSEPVSRAEPGASRTPRHVEPRDELIYFLDLSRDWLEKGTVKHAAGNIEKALKLLSGRVRLTPDIEADVRRALGPLDYARDSLSWELEQELGADLKRFDGARERVGELVGPALVYLPPRDGLPGNTPVDRVAGNPIQVGHEPVSLGGLSDRMPDQTITLEQWRDWSETGNLPASDTEPAPATA